LTETLQPSRALTQVLATSGWEEGPSSAVGSTDRSCIECRAPATWAPLDHDGSFEGFICKRCDRKRRRQQTGWWRRIAFQISRRFGI
jgi:hypothetical protein